MRVLRVRLAVLAAVLSLFPAWHLAHGQAVDAAAARVALQTGNASNAIALATQALADQRLSPRDRAGVLIDRGLAHEMLGEHDAALVDLTEAINARALAAPDQARALYNRGVSLDALGQTEDAIGDYSAAIRLNPRHASALNNRGNAYRRLGRLDDAMADYKRSLAAGNPHSEYPNYGLGQIAEAQGNATLARGYYQAALAANPQFALAQERLTALAAAAPSQVLPPPPAASPAPAPRAMPAATQPAAPAPPTTATTITPLEPYVPAASGDGPIVLRPPGSRPTPADDGIVHLRPPKPVRTASTTAPPPRSAAPELKPALGGSGRSETVQLGAWRNEADAADAWNDIVGRASNMLSGLSPQVVPVDLPGRGRYYRLRAGPVYDGAAKLCAALATRKVGCMVVRN
jgi:tetratricopeptide (TPR) repeat protein